jgi:hypothetical protein
LICTVGALMVLESAVKRINFGTAGLGVSRKADAWDQENKTYLQATLIAQSSVRRGYRIGPDRVSQAG